MPATLLLSSHSELDPPLPIPNRAVKRLSADDSADYPCESRTSSGTHKAKRPISKEVGRFALWSRRPSRRTRREGEGLTCYSPRVIRPRAKTIEHLLAQTPV